MKQTDHRSPRPAAVAFAVLLLVVSVAIGFVILVAPGVNMANPSSVVVLGCIVAIPALLIWLISQGKNWARWVFLVQFGLSLLLVPRCLSRLETYSGLYVVSFCLMLALTLTAAGALCLPGSRRWFRGGPNAA